MIAGSAREPPEALTRIGRARSAAPVRREGGPADDKVQSFGADTPLGRAGQPAELAPAYVFFASRESSFVSGETLGVTGGKPLN